MRTKFKAFRDKVIVLVDCQEKKSAGGIIMETKVNTEDMRREEGSVIDLGKACFYDTEAEDISVGDRVAFARYAGKVLDVLPNGDQIRVMRDIDLLCKVES